MFYVYLLRSKKDNNFYIGFTNCLHRRIQEHNDGKNITTSKMMPVELIYYKAFKSKKDAMEREKQLKNYGNTLGQLKKRLYNSLKSAG